MRPGDRRDAAARAALADELAVVYAEVDAAFAGWSCPASTECCRFGVTGREPYVTSIELAVMRRAFAAKGARRKAESRRGKLPLLDPERRCPLLEGGRCSIYADRPLGCRTFFCDRADAGDRVRNDEIRRFVQAIQGIAARHEPGGDQGRPLTRAW